MNRRTRRGDRPAREGRGFFERFVFSFMGPPQLGDVNAPASVAPDPAAGLCHKCRRPWEEHERVSTGSMTYVQCPLPDAEAPDRGPG